MPLITCPNCHRSIDTDSIFCKHCAFNLSGSSQKYGNAKQQNLKAIIVLCGVFILIVALIALFNYKKPAQSYNAEIVNNLTSTSSPASRLTTKPAAKPAATSATSSNELTREAIMSLLGNKREPVKIGFARSQFETFGSEYYERLINDRVIICTKKVIKGSDLAMYQNCAPGPNGNELVVDGDILGLIVAYKEPAQITGVSRLDTNTAIADVLIETEKTPSYATYDKYKMIFNPYGTKRINLQSETRRAYLRLYDDGWRVERF